MRPARYGHFPPLARVPIPGAPAGAQAAGCPLPPPPSWLSPWPPASLPTCRGRAASRTACRRCGGPSLPRWRTWQWPANPCSAATKVCGPTAVLLLLAVFSPLWLVAALVGYYFLRAQVRLDAAGLRAREFFTNRLYPWSDIEDVRVVMTRKYTNNIRTGTERHVDIYYRGKWRTLPVSAGGIMQGKASFERQATQIWQVWQSVSRQLDHGRHSG